MTRELNFAELDLHDEKHRLDDENRRCAEKQIDCVKCNGYGTIEFILSPCNHAVCSLYLSILSHFGNCPTDEFFTVSYRL